MSSEQIQVMLKSAKNTFSQLKYFLLLFVLLIFVNNLFQVFDTLAFLPAIAIIISFSLSRLRFRTSQWETPSQKSKKKILWVVFFTPFILYIPLNLALLSVGMVEPKLHDFGAYYNAAVRWLNGAPLYQTTQEVPALEAQISSDMPYLYPPIFVLIFVPFTVFSPIFSGIIWNVLTLAFLIWSTSKLLSTFNIDIDKKKKIILYLCIVSFGPTITWMKAGQISGLLAGCLCLSGATLRSRQHRLSGIITTIGSVIKPFYATSGAYLLRHRQRFLSAVISGIGVIAIGLLIFGIGTHEKYLIVLFEGKGWGVKNIGPGNWAADHFEPFYILRPIKHIPRVVIVLATAGVAMYSNKSKVPIEYIFALGIAIIPIAGPTTNTLALNAVIPAILIIGLYEFEKTGKFPKILAISSLLIHVHPYTIEFLSKFGPQIYPPLESIKLFIPLLQPALYGMALLVGYIFYRSSKNPVI
jgi:hypothetical protein